MSISAYPLSWPEGWRRTAAHKRQSGRFCRKEREYRTSGGSWMPTKDISVSDGLRGFSMRGGLIMRVLFMLICCLAGVAQGADLGVSMSGSYYLQSSAPAGWNIQEGDPEQYKIAATLYVSQGPMRFALQPYLEGDRQPRLAGAYLGLGVDLGDVTLSLFHHSCHNLDVRAYYLSLTRGKWLEAPACDFDGINVRLNLGRTFAPLW